MLLGPSGQNIYPEEMEVKLSDYPFVLECVITEREGKLVAFVFPDTEQIEKEKPDQKRLNEIMAENCKQVNKKFPKFAQLNSIILVDKNLKKRRNGTSNDIYIPDESSTRNAKSASQNLTSAFVLLQNFGGWMNIFGG